MTQSFDTNSIAALFTAQIAIVLYGAGLRRPFGSLATVTSLPTWLRQAKLLTVVADCIFWSLAVVFWYVAFHRFPLATFLIALVCASIVGDYLSHRITLIPSFFLSLALGLISVFLLELA